MVQTLREFNGCIRHVFDHRLQDICKQLLLPKVLDKVFLTEQFHFIDVIKDYNI